MRIRAWLWLLVLLVLGAYGAWRFHRGQAIQTDLLAMLPDTEKSPVAEEALRRLTQAGGDRAFLLVGHADPEVAKAAARDLTGTLQASGAFAHVLGPLPPVDPTQLARFYEPYRFRLSGGMEEGDPARALQSRLVSPAGTAGGLGLAQDPLGELDGFLASLPLAHMKLELCDGWLAAREGERLYVLVTATLPGSAFDPDVQTRSLGALRESERRARRPGLELLHTGAVFYAEQARLGAEREMNFISTISMVAIAGLYLFFFRTLRHMLLGTGCVFAGLLLAGSVSVLLYGQLHLLTLVCGASVLGGAVDFSSHYFAHHQGHGEAWEAHKAMRHLFASLTLAFLTTLVGYAALMVTPFPGLRQIAVFTALGLGGAYLTVVLALPDMLKRPAKERPALTRRLRRWQFRAHAAANHPRLVPILVAGLLLLGLAALPLRVQDNANALIQTSEGLRAEEARVRSLTGLSIGGTFFLVEGKDEGEVLAREEALRARLAPALASGELDALQGVSTFVPSPERQDVELQGRRARFPALRAALADSGFRPEVIQALRRDLDACPPLDVATWLAQPFATPYRTLWFGPTATGQASLLLPMGAPEAPRMRALAQGLPGVRYVDKASSVGTLLGHWRRIALVAMVASVFGVWAVLAFRYGPRGAFWVTLPAALGILVPVAGLALAGIPLTLFAVMGLILTLGFSVDYTIFLREGDLRDASTLLGILLSGGSTLISYGLLVFSRTPILRGFGLVIALGVVGSLLSAPLALRGRPRRLR